MMLAARLSDFALGAVAGDAAASAKRIMALSLYDWMACGIAGVDEPVSRIMRLAKPELPDGSRVFGSDATYAPADAALINGATSHALDYDDTHFAHIGHPSVAVLPAAFAAGQGNGADVLDAALIGTELSVRVGEWLGRTHYQTGFHQTATAGAFGAAAAAGRLLGLSQGQLVAAFGIAATQAAGLKSQFGTMGKPYHAGLAARTGVEAATLARAGFDTRGEGLDGAQGFGPTHHGEANLTAFHTLGTAWRMETVSHKFHACCHGLHAMLEALATVAVDPGRIEAVTVTTHPRWMSVCNIPDPKTGLETKFSYRHTAAMALTGISTAALDSYTDTLAGDAGLAELRARVTVVADEAVAETASRVNLTLTGGEAIAADHDLNAPISAEARAARLRGKGRALLGDQTEAQLWQASDPQKAPNLDALLDLMSG
ncbi:MmgE/PrpD family protein [Aliishimia ponticola]|uniref:MmgE/PrpD family protein n=1 Tax=Aliishimia ponticola TaxID=2499833 RepID=A0A4V3XKZ0_9RHOB|nr:MmgE/PrpD family protein [Aliishimia ponticola]THH38743.1 MmgE/PrpD family protein [Aliishimia ponticola]